MGLAVMLGDQRNSAGLIGCSLAHPRPESLLLLGMSVCSLSSPPEAIDGRCLAAVENNEEEDVSCVTCPLLTLRRPARS